jgi:hypothetical protein
MDIYRARHENVTSTGTEVRYAKSGWDYNKKGKIWTGSGPFRNSMHMGILGRLKTVIRNEVEKVDRDPSRLPDLVAITMFIQGHILPVTVEEIDLENMIKNETSLASWMLPYVKDVIVHFVEGNHRYKKKSPQAMQANLDLWEYVYNELSKIP